MSLQEGLCSGRCIINDPRVGADIKQCESVLGAEVVHSTNQLIVETEGPFQSKSLFFVHGNGLFSAVVTIVVLAS